MSALTVTYDLATRFMSFLRVEVDTGPGELNVLALKGIEPTTPGGSTVQANNDQPNRYNDTIALVRNDSAGASHVECFVGTVDPGSMSGSADGAAHLTFGQHLYKKGKHKGHDALVSANGKNRVWRDKNGNFKPDVGEAVFEGVFGVNVHAGGAANKNIGSWSLGCINIAGGYTGPAYKRFLTLADEHQKVRKIVRVTVWRGRDLIRFDKDGPTFRPSLSLGMKNGWVAEMQALLLQKGVTVGVDGDWGKKTTEAVLKFQQATPGLDVDGWVGEQTWTALLA